MCINQTRCSTPQLQRNKHLTEIRFLGRLDPITRSTAAPRILLGHQWGLLPWMPEGAQGFGIRSSGIRAEGRQVEVGRALGWGGRRGGTYRCPSAVGWQLIGKSNWEASDLDACRTFETHSAMRTDLWRSALDASLT